MIVTASDWIPHPEGIFLGRITAVDDTNRQLEGILEKNFTVETKNLSVNKSCFAVCNYSSCQV